MLLVFSFIKLSYLNLQRHANSLLNANKFSWSMNFVHNETSTVKFLHLTKANRLKLCKVNDKTKIENNVHSLFKGNQQKRMNFSHDMCEFLLPVWSIEEDLRVKNILRLQVHSVDFHCFFLVKIFYLDMKCHEEETKDTRNVGKRTLYDENYRRKKVQRKTFSQILQFDFFSSAFGWRFDLVLAPFKVRAKISEIMGTAKYHVL